VPRLPPARRLLFTLALTVVAGALAIGSAVAAPSSRELVASSASYYTFHVLYPPDWTAREEGDVIAISSPAPVVTVTFTRQEATPRDSGSDLLEGCASRLLQAAAPPATPAANRQSLITANSRSVAFEARGTNAAGEPTVYFAMCMGASANQPYPVVKVAITAPARAYDAQREAALGTAYSLRFRPIG
jgi:hypothetical protein